MQDVVIRTGTCYFSHLPFYWRPLTEDIKNLFPATLPFELFWDKEMGLLRQRSNPQVNAVLQDSYRQGTYVEGLMDAEGIGNKYTRDFLGFIDRIIGLKNLAGKKVLEIGCGTGYLLHLLREYGADVTGYEPGFARVGKFDVPVVEQFFPSKHVAQQKFDVIIAFSVLEHIESPDGILKDIRQHLADEGTVIFSVPDCQDHVAKGDLSMLIHEHFSYFTLPTFRTFLKNNHLMPDVMTHSGFGGCIYAACYNHPDAAETSIQEGAKDCEGIFERIQARLERFGKFLSNHSNETLGVYVPMRAFNTLYLLGPILQHKNVSLRFFDDSPLLHGFFCPAFDVPVESRQGLLDKPCKTVIICSYTFAHVIKEQLKPLLPADSQIVGMDHI